MTRNKTSFALVLTLAAGLGSANLAAQSEPSNCKTVHAEMVEARSTTGCKPGHAVCFLGEIDGNQGLRGTTYFKGESPVAPIATSPEFVGYSGVFEYTTPQGTIVARETGVTSTSQRVVTAHQRIISATGAFAGSTGFFFVSGTNSGQQVVTMVTGEICYPSSAPEDAD
jgi:hypothetical protein